MLLHTEPGVVSFLAQWRSRVHYLYANGLAQVYFLRVAEWDALRGCNYDGQSFQQAVATQATHAIAQAEMRKLPKRGNGALPSNIPTAH